MKKLFTLITAVMVSLNLFAAKLDAGAPTNNAAGVFDASTKVITFAKAGDYKPGWWFAWNNADNANTGNDYSAYDEFVVELEPTDFDILVYFEYIDNENEATIVSGKAGKIVVPLDAARKTKVKQAYLQVGEDGVGKSVLFKEAYFQNQEEAATSAVIFDTPVTNPLDWSDNKVSASITTEAKTLLEAGNILRIEYTNYAYENENDRYYQVQVMGAWWTILNSTTKMENVQLNYKEEDGSISNAILNLDGTGTLDIVLNESDVATLKEQAGLLLAGHGILVQKISILKGTTTNISNTIAAPTSTSAKTYNLAGQQVDASYKGVVIKGGKKFVQK